MDNMPHMSEQNKVENTGRYRTKKLSPILPKMQAGNSYERTTNEDISYHRARRKDAEPITHRFEMRLSALSFLTTYAIADRLQLRRQFYEDKAAVLLLQNWIYGDVIKSPIFRDMAVSLEVSSCPFYVNTVFQSYPSKWRSTA